MRTGAGLHASILMVALSAFSCQERTIDTVQTVPASIPPADTGIPAFRLTEGPEPGTDTPYNGTILDWIRWTDTLGGHVVIVSEVTGVSLLEGYPNRTPLQARHYRETTEGNKLAGRWVDSVDTPVKGIKPLLYKDSIWAYDLDGDGLGEVFLAYHIDNAPETGPKRLGLVVFSNGATYGITGSTGYDAVGHPRIAAVTVSDPVFSQAPEYIRDEALKLWNEAQFYLAEPPAFPGFVDFTQFDGATFRGYDPVWSLTLLPSRMELTVGTDIISAVIAYTSISGKSGGLIIEGSGIVEAWNHTFRVTIEEKAYTSPAGQKFQYGARNQGCWTRRRRFRSLKPSKSTIKLPAKVSSQAPIASTRLP